jgi:hypothetical protein
MLQEALIRLMNMYITDDIMEEAVIESGEVEADVKEITLSEFRGIYKSLQQLLKGKEDGNEVDMVDDDSVSSIGSAGELVRSKLKIDYNAPPQTAPAISSNMPSLGNHNKQATSAPLLNLARLRQAASDEEVIPSDQNDSQDHIQSLIHQPSNKETAAGSGLNVARKKNLLKISA